MRSSHICLLLVAFGTPACESDCEVACEADRDCPNGRTLFGDGPCDELCDSVADASDRAGCSAELDGLMLCRADAGPSGCDDACDAQEEAYGACIGGQP